MILHGAKNVNSISTYYEESQVKLAVNGYMQRQENLFSDWYGGINL